MVQAVLLRTLVLVWKARMYFFFLFGHFLNPLLEEWVGFENPLNPSYYPSNGASDLPTYFCQHSLRATPKVKHESPQTII